MSRTWYGHYIMPIKGEDYVLFKDYLELDKKIDQLKKQNNDLRRIYRNTYQKLRENGNGELACYFQAQIDECPTFYVEPVIDYAKNVKIALGEIDTLLNTYKEEFEEDDTIAIEAVVQSYCFLADILRGMSSEELSKKYDLENEENWLFNSNML